MGIGEGWHFHRFEHTRLRLKCCSSPPPSYIERGVCDLAMVGLIIVCNRVFSSAKKIPKAGIEDLLSEINPFFEVETCSDCERRPLDLLMVESSVLLRNLTA